MSKMRPPLFIKVINLDIRRLTLLTHELSTSAVFLKQYQMSHANINYKDGSSFKPGIFSYPIST